MDIRTACGTKGVMKLLHIIIHACTLISGNTIIFCNHVQYLCLQNSITTTNAKTKLLQTKRSAHLAHTQTHTLDLLPRFSTRGLMTN